MATVIVNPGNTLIVSAPGPQGPAGGGGGGGVTDGDKGDLTVSGGGTTWTIDADAVTFDKIQNVTGPTLLGRQAATAGSAEAITLGSGLSIDGSKQLTITAAYAQQSVTMTAGTGLTGGGDLSANRTFAVAYGSTASTACEGNDARLSDSRTPTAHTHALADLQQGGATTNQVVTWNGSAWAPSSPSGTGTVTSVIAGDGLLGGNITTSGTIDVNFGTAGNTVCEGNDSRLSDARTPTSHTHAPSDIQQGGATSGQVLEWSGTAWAPATLSGGGGGTVTSVTAGTGLTGGTITGTGTIAADFGTTSGTICQGNDSRLSDARTPTSHAHGNITNAGAIGTTAFKPIITSVGGELVAGDFGTTNGTFCQGNDSRLSDARTPTAHTHALADLQQGGATSGQVVAWNGTAWAPATPSGGGGGSGLLDPTTELRIFTTFAAPNGKDNPFQAYNFGSSQPSYVAGDEDDAVGVIRMSTGTGAANHRAVLYMSSDTFASRIWRFEDVASSEIRFKARFVDNNFASAPGVMVAGFSSSGQGNVGAGFYAANFIVDSTDTTKYYAQTKNTTATGTDTGISAVSTNTWKHFRILVEEVSGTLTALFYIDGSLVATHTTNLPVGAGRALAPFFGIQKSDATATASNFDIDYCYLRVAYKTALWT